MEPAAPPVDVAAAEPVPPVPEPVASAASQPEVPAAQAVAAAASAASAPVAFEWPPSTQLSYRLRGNYRGTVTGRARVEWLRDGRRYQVHLEVAVGPGFAPLISRTMSSEGVLTPQGIQPERWP